MTQQLKNSKNQRNDIPKREVNLNYALSNSCNGADLMFLIIGLSLIVRRLSFNFNL